MHDFNKKYSVWFEEVKKEGIDISKVYDVIDKMKLYCCSKDMKIVSWPQNTKSINDIKVHLDILEEEEGFIPDVVITDLADRMIPDSKRKEYRHGLNEVWAAHRTLAQERHCLVISATHTNKKTNFRDIQQGDSSEDVRKESHLTMSITINQTDEEKAKGILRIGAMNARNSSFNAKKFLVATQQLELGKPYIDFL
jgi:hypothetical protein